MDEAIKEALRVGGELNDAYLSLKNSVSIYEQLMSDGAEIRVFTATKDGQRQPVSLSASETEIILTTVTTFIESHIRDFKSKVDKITTEAIKTSENRANALTEADSTLDVTEILAEATEEPTENIEHWPDKEPIVPVSMDLSEEEPKKKAEEPSEDKKKPGRTPRVPIEKILSLVNDGYKVKEIAKMLNMDQSTIYERIKTYKKSVQQQRETEAKEDASCPC